MADKKDLVEAYAFSRRRLVTAFVSGAPGGREVEPVRTGRTVVGGLALAVLLLAGAAVAGVFHDQSDVDWSEPGLIIDEGTGALYVNLGEPRRDEPGLRAVVNVTSAQLILGSDVKPLEVPSDEIARRKKGPAIGIVNAPATVPSTGQLIDSGWTACTGKGLETKVTVAEEPVATAAPEAGLVVTDGERNYLVATAPATNGKPATALRYPMPDVDELHNALGVAHADHAIEVSPAWLDLFPEGGSLDAEGLAIGGAGQPLPGTAKFRDYPRDARVGDYFEDDGLTYVLTREGPVEAHPFPLAVLREARFAGRQPEKVTVDGSVELDTVADAPYQKSRWPRELPTGPAQQLDSTQVCAVLDTEPGRPPAAGIALEPRGSAAAEEGSNVVPQVASGRGAVVRSADWETADRGAPYLVDDRGRSYRLEDQQAIRNLGYGGVDWVVVPDVWLELFEDGVALSREDALCPPAVGADPQQCM